MTIGLSNIIHTEEAHDNTTHLRHVVSRWMRRSWRKYTDDDGVIDVESLAEQAVWEFGVSREVADEMANELSGEVATTVTAIKVWAGRPGSIEEMLG